MEISAPFSRIAHTAQGVSGALAKWFPRPRVLFPGAAGVDISDCSIKWLTLEEDARHSKSVRAFGHEPLEPGIVNNGLVQDVERLGEALKKVGPRLGAECAHAALPEETAYVFSMHVPEGSSRAQTFSMIEFELEGRVPIAPSAAVYDFDTIIKHDDGVGEEIGVTVFPRELSESYAQAFAHAGIPLLSLEVEARSIARAVSRRNAVSREPITLLVDFGKFRSGLAVLKRGIPIFTSTVEVGGDMIDQVVLKALSLPPKELDDYKNTKGLLAANEKEAPVAQAITKTVSALADEITRHFHYWDTRRNEHGDRVTPVERVLLVGGSANLYGLEDYVAARVQVACERPNVWQNVCSFDEYVPSIGQRTSLQYVTAIGLALRNF